MAEIVIRAEHQQQVARAQHVLEWLQAERARLLSEFSLVSQQGAREQARMAEFLGQQYGVTGEGWTLDAERGVVLVPEGQSEAEDESPFLGGS
jgi:hypothetical protein